MAPKVGGIVQGVRPLGVDTAPQKATEAMVEVTLDQETPMVGPRPPGVQETDTLVDQVREWAPKSVRRQTLDRLPETGGRESEARMASSVLFQEWYRVNKVFIEEGITRLKTRL